MARWSISEWGCVIDGAQNQRAKLLDLITKNIEKRNPPGTKWRFQEIKTKGSLFIPFGKKTREFLEFINFTKGMGSYTVEVCADPYGNTLTVHSGLCVIAWGSGGFRDWQEKKVSWEDQTVLSDWASVIFRSVYEACQNIMEELGQSPEKLKAETKGILSIW